MNVSPASFNCQSCGTPLDRQTLGGLCPRCVALDVFAPAPPGDARSEPALPGAGERRLGDYELLEQIARGGMGVVYLARQISLGRQGAEVVVCDTMSYVERARAKVFTGCVAFVPDSSALLLGNWSGSNVLQWDWQGSLAPSEFLDAHGTWPRAVVSPRGDVLAVSVGAAMNPGGPEGTTALYDPVTRQLRRTLPESGGHFAFSPDGNLLATGAWQGKIKLWNPATAELRRELTNATLVQHMIFSPDGRTLAVCTLTDDGTWLYEVSTGAQRQFARGITCCAWGAAFSPDGATLATADTDQTMRLWDVASGRQIARFLGHSYQVDAIAWSPDGKTVATGGADGAVRVWDLAAATKEEETIPGEVKPGMFSRDGKLVAVTEPGGVARLRELPSLQVLGSPHQIGQPLGFSADATAFISIRRLKNAPSEVVSWHVPDFALLQEIPLPGVGSPESSVQLSPDGNLLANSGHFGEVRVWNLADHGKLLARASMPDNDYAREFAFSQDGRRLAITFPDQGYLWDMKSGNPPQALSGPRGHGVIFSKDGRILVGNGESGANGLTFWDVATGKVLGGLIGRWGGVVALDLSPDGKTLAIPTQLGLRLWNMTTRREVARYEAAQASKVAFAPDGNELFCTEERTNGLFTIVRRAPSFQQTDAHP